MYENPIVSELPKFSAQQKISLAPAYVLSRLVSLLITLLVAAIAFIAATIIKPELIELRQNLQLLWLLPLLGAMAIWVWVSSRYRAYSLRQEDVSFYSGVIFRRIVIQPVSRVQHIEISRGAVERVFGLATLKLFSAGGTSHALAIPGLKNDTAEALRDQITSSRSLQRDQ